MSALPAQNLGEFDFPFSHVALAEWRDVADPKRARYLAECPQVLRPLGFNGRFEVETTVMDAHREYYISSLTIQVAKSMSAVDVLLLIIEKWSDFPRMNAFIFSALSVPSSDSRCFSVILWTDVDELTDEHLDEMPFGESGEDTVVSARDRRLHLALFEEFVSILEDVDEDPEHPENVDWVNRLGWAWNALSRFADRMGRDFADSVRRRFTPGLAEGDVQ